MSRDVFNDLWDCLPHPPGSVVRLFARTGDHRTGDYARNATEIRRFVRANQGQNVYISLNPTCSTKGIRHSADDVTHWSFFPIDIDPVEEGAQPELALREALTWLGEWTGKFICATTIVDSGRGVQSWIRLNDIEFTDVLSRATVRRVTGYWMKKLDAKLGVSHGCRIDTSVTDLPRVMRCVGTVNQKTGRKAHFLSIQSAPYVGLAEIMVTGTPPEAITDPPSPEGVRSGQRWQKVFVHMTVTAQNYLLHGQEEPGRHKQLWHTAKKFAELGVTVDEARRALRRANGLMGADAALPLDQVERALEQAYQGTQTIGDNS